MSEGRRPTSNTEAAAQRRQARAARVRRNRILAGGILVGTLLFHCAGIVLYVLAPAEQEVIVTTSTPTAASTQDTGGADATDTPRQTNTSVATNTPFVPPPTPGFRFPTSTPVLYTNTPAATSTPRPTNTPAATNTPAPTSTPSDTPTPAVSDTPIPFLDS